MSKTLNFAALALLATFTSVAFAAEPRPGSIAAAKELALQFLPLLSTAGTGAYDISNAVEHDGKVTVNAGRPMKDLRNSCSVTMVRHRTANKLGWVVEAYACGEIQPAR